MKVEVRLAILEESPIVTNLVHLYLYEFSDVDGRDIGQDGRFHYASLDAYWSEPGRYPFLIRVEGQLAGFALVAERRIFEAGRIGHTMAEFFVLRKYRRRGVGEAAARMLFDRFPGPWWVPEHELNRPAQAFWRSVIGRYRGGAYEEDTWEWEGGERGIAQTFVAGSDR